MYILKGVKIRIFVFSIKYKNQNYFRKIKYKCPLHINKKAEFLLISGKLKFPIYTLK